jgi:hypothetical protein
MSEARIRTKGDWKEFYVTAEVGVGAKMESPGVILERGQCTAYKDRGDKEACGSLTA